MSFGSDSPAPPPPPKLPPPPKPQELLDFIDEIAGVKAVTVTGPNGKKQRVLKKLPRSPQEEQHYRMGEQMLGEALKAIPELQRYNPESVVQFEPFINVVSQINEERMRDLGNIPGLETIQDDVNSFRQVQRNILENTMNRQRRRLDTDLSLRGRAQGSYAAAQRAELAAQERMAREQGELTARQYGRDLQRDQLGNYEREFGLREQARQQKLGGAQLEYQLQQQQLSDVEAKRQQALNDRYRQLQIGAGLRGEDVNKAVMSRAPELALQQQNIMTGQDLNAYSANIGRMNQNYQNQLGHYAMTEQMRQPSFGEFLGNTLGNVVGTVGGSMLMGPKGSGGNMLSRRLFG